MQGPRVKLELLIFLSQCTFNPECQFTNVKYHLDSGKWVIAPRLVSHGQVIEFVPEGSGFFGGVEKGTCSMLSKGDRSPRESLEIRNAQLWQQSERVRIGDSMFQNRHWSIRYFTFE